MDEVWFRQVRLLAYLLGVPLPPSCLPKPNRDPSRPGWTGKIGGMVGRAWWQRHLSLVITGSIDPKNEKLR